jgi:hypothetical protein
MRDTCATPEAFASAPVRRRPTGRIFAIVTPKCYAKQSVTRLDRKHRATMIELVAIAAAHSFAAILL